MLAAPTGIRADRGLSAIEDPFEQVVRPVVIAAVGRMPRRSRNGLAAADVITDQSVRDLWIRLGEVESQITIGTLGSRGEVQLKTVVDRGGPSGRRGEADISGFRRCPQSITASCCGHSLGRLLRLSTQSLTNRSRALPDCYAWRGAPKPMQGRDERESV